MVHGIAIGHPFDATASGSSLVVPLIADLTQHLRGGVKVGTDSTILDIVDPLVVSPEPTYACNTNIVFTANSGELSTPSISGTETVVDLVGTATVDTIENGSITFTDGTFFSLLLDNGDHYVASAGVDNVVHNVAEPYLWDDLQIWDDSDIWEDNV